MSEENGPAETIILRLGHEAGDVTSESLIHVECGARFICNFSGVGMKGTAKGPLLSTQANGEVATQKQTVNLENGGFLCPETAKLDIITTPLSPTYIST